MGGNQIQEGRVVVDIPLPLHPLHLPHPDPLDPSRNGDQLQATAVTVAVVDLEVQAAHLSPLRALRAVRGDDYLPTYLIHT